MVVFRCRAGRHRRTAEIQRLTEALACRRRRVPGNHGFHDLRACRFRLVGAGDEGRQLRTAGLNRRQKRCRDLRVELGKVALKVEDDVEPAIRVDKLHRLECPVGP